MRYFRGHCLTRQKSHTSESDGDINIARGRLGPSWYCIRHNSKAQPVPSRSPASKLDLMEPRCVGSKTESEIFKFL